MPDLDFQVESAEAVAYAASPQLSFKLRIKQIAESGEPLVRIHSIALRCQIRLEPGRRRYSPSEQEKLVDLYGEPHRWGQTVRSTLWVNTAVVASSFVEDVLVDLPVACTYDFNVATAKYFHALEDGDVPVCLLFSGTIFYEGDDGGLQVAQVSWERECNFRLPVATWKQMMEIYYPNSAWLCLRRDVFERLYRFKSQRGAASWEEAVDTLLNAAEERVST